MIGPRLVAVAELKFSALLKSGGPEPRDRTTIDFMFEPMRDWRDKRVLSTYILSR